MNDSHDPAASAAASLLHFEPVRLRYRRDGWTPARQRAFIAALAECRCVLEACRRVGKSPEAAYKLYRRPDAAGFRAAWHAALAWRPPAPAPAPVPAAPAVGEPIRLARSACRPAAAPRPSPFTADSALAFSTLPASPASSTSGRPWQPSISSSSSTSAPPGFAGIVNFRVPMAAVNFVGFINFRAPGLRPRRPSTRSQARLFAGGLHARRAPRPTGAAAERKDAGMSARRYRPRPRASTFSAASPIALPPWKLRLMKLPNLPPAPRV